MLISFIALIISVVTLAVSLSTFFWTAQRDKKRDTLDAYNTLQVQVFDHLNENRKTYLSKSLNKKDYDELSGLVARIEHFCVGVNTDIYDFKTFHELSKGYFNHPDMVEVIKIVAGDRNGKPEEKERAARYKNIHDIWERFGNVYNTSRLSENSEYPDA